MKDKDNKAVKVLISMRKKFMEEMDEFAEKENRGRSELIREALRFYMEAKYSARNNSDFHQNR